MAKQNIYDNETFFAYFKGNRSKDINFNDCIETPILLSMLPKIEGKRVLDIGCGMDSMTDIRERHRGKDRMRISAIIWLKERER